jgi:hypothetical protein
MGKEMDSVGACLTCWLKDGGQRVGMALPRVIPRALEVGPIGSRDISADRAPIHDIVPIKVTKRFRSRCVLLYYRARWEKDV